MRDGPVTPVSNNNETSLSQTRKRTDNVETQGIPADKPESTAGAKDEDSRNQAKRQDCLEQRIQGTEKTVDENIGKN